MRDVTQFHGRIYGVAPDKYRADQAGDTFRSADLDRARLQDVTAPLGPIAITDEESAPIMVNQYGAVGRVDGQYVWAPASG